jgi:hypothetical protein
MPSTSRLGDLYYTLIFVCMGCHEIFGGGIQGIPVNTKQVYPSWEWDGNLLLPSIKEEIVVSGGLFGFCRATLTKGVFSYHTDSTHSYSGCNAYPQHFPPAYVRSLEMQQAAHTN